MNREGIPTPGEFKANTSPPKGAFKVKRLFIGRGTDLALVDAAVAEWDAAHAGNNVDAKVLALRHLVKSCSLYLKNRTEKKTTLAVKRKSNVRGVLDRALAALKKLDAAEGVFAANKSKGMMYGRFDGKTTGLSGSYKHERTSYLESGKQRAMGASGVNDMANFDSVSYADYVREHKARALRNELDVAYFAKGDRMKYLAIPHDGVFKYADGTPLVSTGTSFSGRVGDMWSMDRYGNLFVKEPKGVQGKLFNHSSFNAGNDVVCAGVCMFNEGGVLVYLDNSSGHYKPDAEALRSALAFFKDEGVRLGLVRVGLVKADGSIANYLAKTVLGTPGITSAQAEDWPTKYNAPLKLPDQVSA